MTGQPNRFSALFFLVVPTLVGCGESDRYEAEAATVCEIVLQRNLKSSDSFRTRGMWTFIEEKGHGVISRDYSAINGFGARMDGTYYCEYDPVSEKVVNLAVMGATGLNVIIANNEDSVFQ